MQPPEIFLLIFLFVLGTIFGSFFNVVLYRLPRKMNIAWPGSHCPHCNHPIRWYHNVPVFGWLLLGGRCYDCKAKISPRYPLVEFLIGVLFAGVGWLVLFSK